MRVALCQILSLPEPTANLDPIRDRVHRAAGLGAEVVVFPEASMACFGGPKLSAVAEPLDGPWASAVREMAEEAGVTVLAGMFTPAPDGRVFNTLLITGGGRHTGYHKIHLFDAFGFTESSTVAPGEQLVTIEVGGLSLGVAVCYDLRFPELFRALADRGAVATLVVASWGAGPGKREQWELLVRARALDTTSWMLACGQADPATTGVQPVGTAPTGIGFSTVADPYGRVHSQLDAKPDMLIVDIDPGIVDEARKAIPVLANRRL